MNDAIENLGDLNQEYFFELNEEVDGKQIGKHCVKDFGCTANCLFMITGEITL